jgi:hypothetical protein
MQFARTYRYLVSLVWTPHKSPYVNVLYRKGGLRPKYLNDLSSLPPTVQSSAAEIASAQTITDLHPSVALDKITLAVLAFSSGISLSLLFPVACASLYVHSYDDTTTSKRTGRPAPRRPLQLIEDHYCHPDSLQLNICASPAWRELQESKLLLTN